MKFLFIVVSLYVIFKFNKFMFDWNIKRKRKNYEQEKRYRALMDNQYSLGSFGNVISNEPYLQQQLGGMFRHHFNNQYRYPDYVDPIKAKKQMDDMANEYANRSGMEPPFCQDGMQNSKPDYRNAREEKIINPTIMLTE